MVKQKGHLRTVYLYADGHAVLIYEKPDKDAGTVEWAELVQKFGPRCDFEGRIIFGSALAKLIKGMFRVYARPASVDHGSENSKRLKIVTQPLSLYPENNMYGIYLTAFPEIINSDWTYQPETAETWDDVREKGYWSDYRIGKVHAVKESVTPQG